MYGYIGNDWASCVYTKSEAIIEAGNFAMFCSERSNWH